MPSTWPTQAIMIPAIQMAYLLFANRTRSDQTEKNFAWCLLRCVTGPRQNHNFRETCKHCTDRSWRKVFAILEGLPILYVDFHRTVHTLHGFLRYNSWNGLVSVVISNITGILWFSTADMSQLILTMDQNLPPFHSWVLLLTLVNLMMSQYCRIAEHLVKINSLAAWKNSIQASRTESQGMLLSDISKLSLPVIWFLFYFSTCLSMQCYDSWHLWYHLFRLQHCDWRWNIANILCLFHCWFVLLLEHLDQFANCCQDC